MSQQFGGKQLEANLCIKKPPNLITFLLTSPRSVFFLLNKLIIFHWLYFIILHNRRSLPEINYKRLKMRSDFTYEYDSNRLQKFFVQ